MQEMVYLKAMQKSAPMGVCVGNHWSKNVSEKI